MEINRLSLDIPIIASIFGSTLDEISQVAKKINESKASLIELNISCPNVKGVPFASDPLLAKEAVKRAKEVLDIPLIAKLSPNVTNISQIAKAISRHVDAISAINTVGGMAIDIHAKAPILSNKFGGLSGPAIKPIGIKCVYEIYKSVDLPIIGMGGISTPEDAIEYLLAGATCVGIGSAIKTYDFSIFKKITQGMVDYLDGEPITKIIGAAHKTP
jgi:dihydroorotate dehydrogenase (NAD+) catalytic subunit